jgi:hypothetical protein
MNEIWNSIRLQKANNLLIRANVPGTSAWGKVLFLTVKITSIIQYFIFIIPFPIIGFTMNNARLWQYNYFR